MCRINPPADKEVAMQDVSTLISRIVAKPPMRYYYHNRRSNARSGVDRFLTNGIALSRGQPFSILPPHDWGAEAPGDREWQVLRNAFFHVDWIFQAFIETDDPCYLHLAGSNLIDWVTYNLHRNVANRAKWSDICVGLRAFYFAFALDRCAREPSCRHMIPLLLEGAMAHAAELMKPEGRARSNHAIFQALGLASLAGVIERTQDDDVLRRTAEGMFEVIIAAQYGHEGVHLEHSPYYHGWVLQRLKQIVDLKLFGEDDTLTKLVTICAANFVHFFRPDGSLSEIGDSSPEVIQWAADLNRFLLYGASRGGDGQPPANTDCLFAEAGYLIFRDSFAGGLGASHLICHAGHHMPSHKHDDDLTVEWSERCQRILVDSGKYSYDINPDRDYVLSRRAHNVVEIDDGGGFEPGRPYGAASISKGLFRDVKFARLDLPVARLGCRQSRVLFLRHDHFLIVADSIRSDDRHDYVQWFHFPPESVVSPPERHAAVAIPNGDGELMVRVTALSQPAAALEVVKGRRTDRMQGWVSPSYAELVAAPALGIRHSGSSVLIVTILEIGNGGIGPVIPEHVAGDESGMEIRFRWSAAHSPTRICLNNGTFSIDGPVDRNGDEPVL